MQVLITGGTGFLGPALVRAFARAGHSPVVFARRASTSGLPGKLIDGDVRNRDALALCHAHRIPRFIYTSSFLALPPAGHPTPLTANDLRRLEEARARLFGGTPLVGLEATTLQSLESLRGLP
jgi:nucleoside-diphosphate-sugar epimerase